MSNVNALKGMTAIVPGEDWAARLNKKYCQYIGGAAVALVDDKAMVEAIRKASDNKLNPLLGWWATIQARGMVPMIVPGTKSWVAPASYSAGNTVINLPATTIDGQNLKLKSVSEADQAIADGIVKFTQAMVFEVPPPLLLSTGKLLGL